jgi:hypothetical protein
MSASISTGPISAGLAPACLQQQEDNSVIKPSIVTAVALAVVWGLTAADMSVICFFDGRDVCWIRRNNFLIGEAVICVVAQIVITAICFMCKNNPRAPA